MHPLTPIVPVMLIFAASASQAEPANRGPEPFPQARVRTIPFDPGLSIRTGTFTPSGKVLVSYADAASQPERQLNLAVMDDDGRNFRAVWSGTLPVRHKDNGIRFMVFPDNQRVFLGDFILECSPSLDDCTRSALLPVEYPSEIADGPAIAHRWSEMIVAPDNRHVAWTTLLTGYTAAVVFTGELARNDGKYRIQAPRIISTLDTFLPDPKHPDGVLPQPVRGGEVKQFVRGGSAISAVGAVRRDTPDSVVQSLVTGVLEPITDTPGYNETTIFSPDERLGVTMTTRFSSETDPAILGLMPRPYPAALNVGLNMFAYTYAVTGVRLGRPGNVGPALIDIAASKTKPGYLGRNLATDAAWVFASPISWHPSGRKAMWMEGRHGNEDTRRMQVVDLPGLRTARPPRSVATPAAPYGSTNLSRISAYAAAATAIDVKVYGKRSGYITYKRAPQRIEKTYVNFSDSREASYNGKETTLVNMGGRSSYTADVTLTGAQNGRMDLTMTFGPLGGPKPAALIFEADASGRPATRGYAQLDGKRLDASFLVP